jgi:hypothetical protein
MCFHALEGMGREVEYVPTKLLIAAILLLISAAPLFAYIDPGTGSYIIQMLIAGFLAAGFVIKTQWRRLAAFFKERSKVKETDANDQGK